MTTPVPYFAAVAEQWDEMREGYFTEHMRDAALRAPACRPGPTRLFAHPGSTNPAVAVDEQGVMHAVWLESGDLWYTTFGP